MGLYLWKLVFPHPLMNDYSINQITISNFSDPFVWFSLAIYGVLIYLLIKCWKNSPIVAFAIGFYLIGMSLYSNLVFTIGTSFGERLLFIPSLGFCLAAAYLITQPFQAEFKVNKFWKSAIKPLSITAVILIAYGFKTIDRNRAWKDNFTLYATDVKNCDRSARCQYYYGLGLMKEKAIKLKDQKRKEELILESVQAFDRALEILPTYSDAYGQRGLAFYRLNNYQAALADYQKAVEYNPSNATALSNMGSLYFQSKQYQKAREAYERALRLNPNHVDALANYASTLGTLGEYNTAITYFKKAIAIKPQEPSYYQMVGITYQNLGNQAMANQYLRKAQTLRNQ
jgi:tetratricopeptide (TPR) repeat protein